MTGLTWLHLSDWHQKGNELKREELRDALIKDIGNRTQTISPHLKKIDFIVVSGDVAFHGKYEEYQAATREFFDPLLKAANVKRHRLFIVPGNHDLNREELRRLPKDLLERFINNPKEIEEWLKDKDARGLFLPMKDYSRFLQEYLPKNVVRSDPAYAYVRSFTIAGKKIGLIGLNSAWLCARHKEKKEGNLEVNDYGHLLVGELQIHQALKKASHVDIKIAVLHHPFDCLMTTEKISEKSRIRERLSKECHFILHGHEHEPNVMFRIGTLGECAVISAGTTYERPEPTASRYAHNYNLVHLNFEKGMGMVYLRRYEERQGWIRDTATTGDRAAGVIKFALPDKKSDTGKEDPFKWKYPFEPKLFIKRKEEIQRFRDNLQTDKERTHLEFIGIEGTGKSELLRWICYNAEKERTYLAAYVDFEFPAYYYPYPEICPILETIGDHISAQLSQDIFASFHEKLSQYFRGHSQSEILKPEKALDNALIEAFNDDFKAVLKSYKIVLCLDSTEAAYRNVLKELEEQVLTYYMKHKNFMLVTAGQKQCQWHEIQDQIEAHNLLRLSNEDVLSQLITLSEQKNFWIEDDKWFFRKLVDLTSGHALLNYELLDSWTNGFKHPLHIGTVEAYENQNIKLIREFIEHQVLKDVHFGKDYPSAKEILKCFAILRYIDPKTLSLMFPALFRACRGKTGQLEYFNEILDKFSSKSYIFMPLSSGPGHNLNPIIRHLVQYGMWLTRDLTEKHKILANRYNDWVEQTHGFPDQIKNIMERLYHYAMFLREIRPDDVNRIIQKELEQYLQKYFFFQSTGSKADSGEQIERLENALEEDRELWGITDVPALQEMIKDFRKNEVEQ